MKHPRRRVSTAVTYAAFVAAVSLGANTTGCAKKEGGESPSVSRPSSPAGKVSVEEQARKQGEQRAANAAAEQMRAARGQNNKPPQ